MRFSGPLPACGTDACTLPSRERIADRTGNHRRGVRRGAKWPRPSDSPPSLPLVGPAPRCHPTPGSSWGGSPPLSGACWPPPVTPVCVCGAAAGNSWARPLQAACLMSAVVPLAALDQACVWQYQSIVPLIVSPLVTEVFMLVWRAGACSHDDLTHQALLPCSLGCHGAPVLAACNAQLIRVQRHCSAESGPPTWHPLRAHSAASLTL